jgi:PPOX class probable F420-dependent enzyme
VSVDPEVVRLARGKNFAVLSVLLASGRPMAHVMWVDADDEHVLINTEVHRAKYRAVQRDPRVTVTIWERDNPYRFAEVRGRVVETVTGPVARAHIDELSRKYRGRDYDDARITSERVLLRIAPDRQHVRGPHRTDSGSRR